VPDIDIITTTESGKTKPVQVKTSNGDSWQLNLSIFIEITMNGNKQILGNITKPPVKGLVYVFTKLGNKYGEDEFYIIDWKKLQNIIINGHKIYLSKNNGERPNNKKSMHSSLKASQINNYLGRWSILL
jgi:hypothetical protein